MTVAVVPYVEQNLSHSAALFRQAFAADWVGGGICALGELAVSAQSSPNMSVQVAAGRAIVPGTNVTPPSGFGFTTQGDYFVLNDATISVTVSAANATNPRIDVVYVGVQDAFYSGSTNTALIGIVTGTPAPSPTVPAIPTNAVALAQIAVAANATSIVNANITAVALLAQAFGGGYTYGAYSPTGLYSPGTPTPRVGLLGSRVFAEGVIVSSSASFTAGTSYNIGSFPAAFAGSNTQTLIATSNITAIACLTLTSAGALTMQLNIAFSGLLALHLDGVNWKPAGY